MASFDVYGGAGNPFGGPTNSWQQMLAAGNNPFHAGQAKDDAYDLRETNMGEGALGYYATQPGLESPFVNWLTSPTTHRQLWDEYEGLASVRGPDYGFQDYLAENDPRLRWMNASPDVRQTSGETPGYAYALPARLNTRQ